MRHEQTLAAEKELKLTLKSMDIAEELREPVMEIADVVDGGNIESTTIIAGDVE
jgi:hypothetical protein